MTDPRHDTTCTRRELYRTALRVAAIGGVAVATAMLTMRRGKRLAENPCISQGVCRGCGVVNGCGLPAALSYKQAARAGRVG